MQQIDYKELLIGTAKCFAIAGASYVAVTYLLKQIDPSYNKQKQIDRNEGIRRLTALGKQKLNLSEHELWIASQLVTSDDINVSWKDIAGLENTIDELYETVIFPIKCREQFKSSKLTQAPKGVLLYGPPGCGKTLIAKATAKEAVASFINLDISMLTDKWYGESQKLVAAVFSLAEKIEPCVIFIDEIDSLLRSRTSQDHEATAMMKAQFMLLWDGLSTKTDKIVIVMGATNRPSDLDSAILRRMPSTFRLPMPNMEQRTAILKLILSQERTEELDYDEISRKTINFSGSDLQELCRNASLARVKELARNSRSSDNNDQITNCELRPINMSDVRKALYNMSNTKLNRPDLASFESIKLD